MSTQPDYPIEPLPDDAWKRIERGVFRELADAPPARARSLLSVLWQRPWLKLAAAASPLLVAAALLLWVRGEPQQALAERYESLSQPSEHRLAGLTLRLEAGSLLLRVHADADTEWVLERGAAEFHVASRVGRAPLAVTAGDVRVEVVGTVFRVARAGESAQVHTLEGTVRVVHEGQSQLIRASERWPSELVPGPAQPQPTPPMAAADASAEAAPQLHSAKRRDADERLRQRYELAAAMERSDPSRALAIYRSLSEKSGPWASNALFAQARLELDRHMYAEAERDLRAYLARYSDAPNAADARALLKTLKTRRP